MAAYYSGDVTRHNDKGGSRAKAADINIYFNARHIFIYLGMYKHTFTYKHPFISRKHSYRNSTNNSLVSDTTGCVHSIDYPTLHYCYYSVPTNTGDPSQ